jgi:hypothetical protein
MMTPAPRPLGWLLVVILEQDRQGSGSKTDCAELDNRSTAFVMDISLDLAARRPLDSIRVPESSPLPPILHSLLPPHFVYCTLSAPTT